MIPDRPREPATLDTVDAVIDALGGTAEVARLVGRGAQAVANWRKRGSMPPEMFLIMSDALAARDLRALPALWGMAEPAEPAVAEARP